MKVFDFDWREHEATYRERGWLHIKHGTTPVFLETAQEFVHATGADQRLGGRGLRGEKGQQLFDFPPDVDYDADVFDVLAPLCGLRRLSMTLSERHVKAYDPDADPFPGAHKDRFSSQVSVGISLQVPAGSHLVLYPHDDVSENPFLDTWLLDSLEPARRPDRTLATASEVAIYDEPGDVVIFRGSAFWHLRRKSAGAVNLYLKFNDFDCDPLGEDPSTAVRRGTTLDALDLDNAELLKLVPHPARRFDSVTRQYRREGWPECLLATVWGQTPFPVSEDEFALLRRVDGRASAADLCAGDADALASIRRLAHRGAIDLVVSSRK